MAETVFCKELYAGKTVVVVGASSGINLGIATRFSELGASLAIISRSEERISQAAEQLAGQTGNPVKAYSSDVRDYEALEKIFVQIEEDLGKIDVLVSGAAGNFMSPVESMSSKGFQTVVDIDLVGTFNVVRVALKHFKASGGAVVNISAPQADNPYPAQAHVAAAKSGINILTKSLALEWGVKGIRVNAISPGPIDDTEGMKRLSPTKEIKDALAGSIPLKRYGEKSEIGDLAIFLCSEAASYITGAVIPCDGGFTLMGAGAWNTNASAPS